MLDERVPAPVTHRMAAATRVPTRTGQAALTRPKQAAKHSRRRRRLSPGASADGWGGKEGGRANGCKGKRRSYSH